uniref:Secreted protein n=1 Tax=Heterorhabditis bacteriophora TaxID=37862 RepID=A0A1I7W9L1_HETBA
MRMFWLCVFLYCINCLGRQYKREKTWPELLPFSFCTRHVSFITLLLLSYMPLVIVLLNTNLIINIIVQLTVRKLQCTMLRLDTNGGS